MTNTIQVNDIYDKSLNFLIGSGASVGLFPSLALKIGTNAGKAETIESLATEFDAAKDPRLTSLFMHYYDECIKPAQVFTAAAITGDTNKEAVLNNYERFIGTILQILQRKKAFDKRCNIFTTNYDGCFALAADGLLENGSVDFVINDGTRGFSARHLQPRNFSSFLCQTGIFERHTQSIPQINLIHLHGSVYWQKRNGNIIVNYDALTNPPLLDTKLRAKLAAFSEVLMDDAATTEDLPDIGLTDEEAANFWNSYKKLPIVNPTKWKFHETVFEEHYYQMLRSLSYELEKPNAILVTFGFSFADEHILSLVKRSLSNPSLQVFVCCFDKIALDQMSTAFQIYPNVQCISVEPNNLTFSEFNDSVFFTGSKASAAPAAECSEK